MIQNLPKNMVTNNRILFESMGKNRIATEELVNEHLKEFGEIWNVLENTTFDNTIKQISKEFDQKLIDFMNKDKTELVHAMRVNDNFKRKVIR